MVVAVNFNNMKYDIIIGLEIHAELNTKSKMFCSCPNRPFTDKPNINVCPVCLGHPGTLPVPNKRAIDLVLMTGMALGSKINRLSKFDRKNYFYPDLPKGYQISQYDLPFCYEGFLKIESDEIEITRIHLEEDTGKSIHKKDKDYSLIDFNRAGAPLLELVTEPTIKDAKQAKQFCQEFRQILRYIGASNANMEKGEMRCEVNISLQEKGKWQYKDKMIKAIDNYSLNNKVEIKNLNSFKSVEKAIEFETKRQAKLIDKGQFIEAETRGFDEKKGETVSQRKKESSADYRYFPEPDIPPINIDDNWLMSTKQELPEMPKAKVNRFVRQFALTEETAKTIATERDLADWYESAVSELGAWIKSSGDSFDRQEKALAKISANWLCSEILAYLKTNKINISNLPITQENFAELMFLIYKEKINSSAGQKVLNLMYTRNESPIKLVEELGLEQVDNKEELKKTIELVIQKNEKQVKEYKAGKTNLIQFFLGQVMAETKGKANPKKAMDILKEVLG